MRRLLKTRQTDDLRRGHLIQIFQLIMLCGRIPSGFRKSYIVLIPKIKATRTKALTCDDFRGIAINPVISRVFEYCYF